MCTRVTRTRTAAHVAGRWTYEKLSAASAKWRLMRPAAQPARACHGEIVAAGGSRHRQVAFAVRVQGQELVGMDGPGGVPGIAWQGIGVPSGARPAHGYFPIAAEEETGTWREKVDGRIVTFNPTLEERAILVRSAPNHRGDDPLSQMDGQVKRRRTVDAIQRVLLRDNINQPLMVVFEDLHWIRRDPGLP